MTWFRWICQRCGGHFRSPVIVSTCVECSVAGPMPFEVSGA